MRTYNKRAEAVIDVDGIFHSVDSSSSVKAVPRCVPLSDVFSADKFKSCSFDDNLVVISTTLLRLNFEIVCLKCTTGSQIWQAANMRCVFRDRLRVQFSAVTGNGW
jgi:hypothetical protein